MAGYGGFFGKLAASLKKGAGKLFGGGVKAALGIDQGESRPVPGEGASAPIAPLQAPPQSQGSPSQSGSQVYTPPPQDPPSRSGRDDDISPSGAPPSKPNKGEEWEDEMGKFLHGNESSFRSSNVASGNYNLGQKYLELGFNNGGRYGYHNVSPVEAMSLYNSPSKGKWVWDNLRRRGTVFGYQKSYTYISGRSDEYQPKYYGSDDHREEHRSIGPGGLTPASWRRGEGPYHEMYGLPRLSAAPHGFSKTEEKELKKNKVPMAYLADVFGSRSGGGDDEDDGPAITPPAKVGKTSVYTPPAKAHADTGSKKAPQHKAEGGFIDGDPNVGDNVPVKATAGEFIVNKEAAAKHQHLLESINREGQDGHDPDAHKPGHYAFGGMVQGLKDYYQRAMSSRQVGAMVGGSFGASLAGPVGAAIGGMLGAGVASDLKGHDGSNGPTAGASGNPLNEAATNLKDAAKMLADAAVLMGAKIQPGSSLDEDKKVIQDPMNPGTFKLVDKDPGKYLPGSPGSGYHWEGDTLTQSMPGDPGTGHHWKEDKKTGVWNLTEGEAPAAAEAGGMASGIASVAGPVGMAFMLAKGATEKLGGALLGANENVRTFSEGMLQAVGVPKSIAEFTGSLFSVVSPLRVLGNTIANLYNPFAGFKANLEAVGTAAGKLVQVFLDMKDPSHLIQQAVAPFIAQVGKFSPATVERFNLALDNLSAAAGYIFQPIIEEARNFADELNSMITAVAPEFRRVVSMFLEPIKDFGREVVAGFISGLQKFAAAAGPAILEITRMGPAIGSIVGGAMRFGGWITEQLTPAFHRLVNATQEVIAAFIAAGMTLRQIANMLPTPASPSAAPVRLFGRVLRRITGGAASAVDTVSGGNITPAENFREAMRMLRETLSRPVSGSMTMAAQPARQVGIEQVGMETRAAAFSQQQSVQERTASATERTAQILGEILGRMNVTIPNLANLFNLNNPPDGVMG